MKDDVLLTGFSRIGLDTPDELFGFGSDLRPCTGVNDPLMVQSLVLENNDNRFAILTIDLLAIDFAEVDEIRSRVASLGLQPENLLIAAAHTHSGPPSIDMGPVKKSRRLAEEVIDKTIQCLDEASQCLSRSSIRTGFATFSQSVNRRRTDWRGRTRLGINPRGPVDQQLSHLLVKNEYGRVLVVSYGCHPVINSSSIASADYVAGIRQVAYSSRLKATLFLAGALGDVNPYDKERKVLLLRAGLGPALQHGGQMATEILKSLRSETEDPSPRMFHDSAVFEVSLPTLQGGQLGRELLVQAFGLGEFVLVAFPGEVFAQMALNLRKTTLTDNLVVVSCANGYIGYIPPRDEYTRGGYEIEIAPRLFGYRVPSGVAEDLQSLAERMVCRGLCGRRPVAGMLNIATSSPPDELDG